jgi:hypothetical protein
MVLSCHKTMVPGSHSQRNPRRDSTVTKMHSSPVTVGPVLSKQGRELGQYKVPYLALRPFHDRRRSNAGATIVGGRFNGRATSEYWFWVWKVLQK